MKMYLIALHDCTLCAMAPWCVQCRRHEGDGTSGGGSGGDTVRTARMQRDATTCVAAVAAPGRFVVAAALIRTAAHGGCTRAHPPACC